MPLSDLINTLNIPFRNLPQRYAKNGLDQPFVAVGGRVFLHYANIRLESVFLPIVNTHNGKLDGHAASIRAFGLSNRLPIAPETVFVLPSDDEEFVYLDRLVRTLHALNYLTNPIQGNLLLEVHARHVLSVPADHGLAFEEILRPCGLLPEQITLKIDSNGIEDTPHLIRAIASYRSRGYGIAIDHFGRHRLDFDLLRQLGPDIVKLDSCLLASTRPLERIIDRLHELPSKVLIHGKDSHIRQKLGAIRKIDLLQTHAPLRLLHCSQPELTNGTPGMQNAA